MEQEDEQEDELIVSADKGNATMMMRWCDWQEDGDVGTGTYGKLRREPTATQKNRMSEL